jgi:hypothetical protein
MSLFYPDYAVGDAAELEAGGGQSGGREPGYSAGEDVFIQIVILIIKGGRLVICCILNPIVEVKPIQWTNAHDFDTEHSGHARHATDGLPLRNNCIGFLISNQSPRTHHLKLSITDSIDSLHTVGRPAASSYP